MVLEKALESTLDSNEIKPVNPKRNQPRGVVGGRNRNQPGIFTGRTDAEAEGPVLWLSDAKS